MPTRSFAAPLGLSFFGPLVLVAAAQQPAPQTPAQQPPPSDETPALTLHAASRIVLADIIVTDRRGNPVHGLTAADFQVLDNGHPQHIASFEENDGTARSPYMPPAASAHVASNNFQHLPRVVNVILIDTTNLELPDQMYLHIQLTKFLKALPGDQPLAVFERHGDNTVLQQGFTSDHALLQAAVDRTLPRLLLGGREYRSDVQTLQEVSAYLRQVPGRKNVLWFSGGSTAFLLAGLSSLDPSAAGAAGSVPIADPSTGEDQDALRKVFDTLDAARIAIYPIDARGLTMGDEAMEGQHSQMDDVAQATGGQAIYNTNGLADSAAHLVSADLSSYTVTYSPQDFQYDSKWHTIRITARNSDYHLSYRRGYFADQPGSIAPKSASQKPLFAGDSSPVTAPDFRSSPIVFEASVHPASEALKTNDFIRLHSTAVARRGTIPFHIDYALTTAGISPATVKGASKATVIFAAVVLSSNGTRVGQALNGVRFSLDPGSPPRHLNVEQEIYLPKGGEFLALAVWDPTSGHMGTLQIPVTVTKPK